MHQIVYVSSATHLFSEEQLLALLAQSRRHNASVAVSGMLLYKDGNFMQLLEGDGDTVRALYANIQADPRHRGVITVLEKAMAQREFSEWSMAFENLDLPQARATPGYSAFFDAPLTAETFGNDPSFAMRMLLLFKANMTARG